MVEACANVNNRVYGKAPHHLEIWTGERFNESLVGFGYRIPLSTEQALGSEPHVIHPFQTALRETLKKYAENRLCGYLEDKYVMGCNGWTKNYSARAEVNPLNHEKAASALIDVAYQYGEIDERTFTEGLERLRFVHTIRYDKMGRIPPTPFQGMRTDTQYFVPIDVFFDINKSSQSDIVQIFAAAKKSKIFGLGSGGDAPFHVQFQLTEGATLKEATQELLDVMKAATIKTIQGPTVPVMTAQQHEGAREALLPG